MGTKFAVVGTNLVVAESFLDEVLFGAQKEHPACKAFALKVTTLKKIHDKTLVGKQFVTGFTIRFKEMSAHFHYNSESRLVIQ